jgi:hypothetical protein
MVPPDCGHGDVPRLLTGSGSIANAAGRLHESTSGLHPKHEIAEPPLSVRHRLGKVPSLNAAIGLILGGSSRRTDAEGILMTSAPRSPAARSRIAWFTSLIGLFTWLSGSLIGACPTLAQDRPRAFVPLGALERVQGEVTLFRGETSIVAKNGDEVARGDTLSTAAESRLLLVFKDGTRLTLGERAEAFIEYFVYNPIKKRGAAFVDIVKGAFRFTSGRIRELNDKRIEVRANSATFAAEGGDFWGGPIEDGYGFLLITGRIEVRNDAGMVVLHKKRVGSTFVKPGGAPDVPEPWSKEKVSRAFATVAFK